MLDPADGKPVPTYGRDRRPAAEALPWLAPDAASLAALAGAVGPAWQSVRHDPGLVLILLRLGHSLPTPVPPDVESLCGGTLPLLFALRLLRGPANGVLDPARPETVRIVRLAQTLAETCEGLAEMSRYPDPVRAWCAGLLAPLGRLAAACSRPESNLDPLAVARRLARRWRLPGWLTAVAGYLDLSSDQAAGLVEDPRLFALARLAVALADRAGLDTGLGGAGVVAEDEKVAGLRLDAVPLTLRSPPHPPAADPYAQPLLRSLLEVAVENRRLRAASAVGRLEDEVDRLHAALRRQCEAQEEARRLDKLSALAEFAAGAGHEINNPLAVISGQAQYILSHQGDWLAADEEGESQVALGKIIAQTGRINNILRQLMQFARPSPARPVCLDLALLVSQVPAPHADAALARSVRVELALPAGPVNVYADPSQVATALGCLLRNAIEAAPPGGWARLAVVENATGVEVHVEDSGPGPLPEHRSHLFDPFFSGRNAGRGQGLGLPVAWRLARLQGGDVVFALPSPGQPTRFVLRLPRVDAATRAA